MPHLLKLPLVTVICAVLALVAPLAKGESPAQTSSSPSQIEREFWEATRQIDTVAAYQAYQSRFPNGFFALLASAAIKKADGAVQADPRATETHGGATLNVANGQFSAAKIAGPTGSRAITHQAGDVFHGPGPVTVGWMGARKQIVVPAGEWILLAAEDSQTPIVTRSLYGSYTPPMSVTTMILARLEGRTVRSFLLARFNSREGGPKYSWADAEDCQSPPPSAPFAWSDRGFITKQCVVASLQSQKSTAKTFAGTTWEEALQKLSDGGGALPGSPYLVTNIYYTGDLSHYLHISRIDFGVSSDQGGSGVPGASFDLSLQAREKWARVYSEVAAPGYRKNLSERDLLAGGTPTIAADVLPD